MNFLKRISRLLADQTPAFVVLAAVVAFIHKPAFLWVKGDVSTLILGIIMLTMGMTLTTDDFRILAKRPLDIFIGACAQYTVMPLLAWSIAKLLHLPDAIAVGLILVGCCPGGVSSNIMSFLCKGDVAFSVGMTTASTLLSPLATPALVLLLAGEKIDVDAVAMFKNILLVTIFPVVTGFLLNVLFGKSRGYRELVTLMPGVSVIGLGCIVGGVVAHHGDGFLKSGPAIFAAVLLHNSLGYALGYGVGLLTRMGPAKCRTISIEVGMQNAGLATNLAPKHFPTLPEAAIASAVSCVWHSVSGALLAGLFNRLRRDD